MRIGKDHPEAWEILGISNSIGGKAVEYQKPGDIHVCIVEKWERWVTGVRAAAARARADAGATDDVQRTVAVSSAVYPPPK